MKTLMIVVAMMFAVVGSVQAGNGSFMCKDYTDNKVNISASYLEDAYETDNPIRSMVTNLRSDTNGYTISQNGLFKKRISFTNPRFDQLNRFASSSKGMIFRKSDGAGNPYFIIMMTSKDEKVGEDPKSNPINRMITLGNCIER